MANYCDYEVRVKGGKKACLMVYAAMPCLDFKEMEWERKDGNTYHISFTGNCKWSVNFGVKDALKRINVASMSESEIERRGTDYWEYSLRAKSEAFQCEIMVHYWSEESEFDQFDHYKNGKVLKRRKIRFDYEKQNEFDWERLEFVGHEGEYDESVDGEQQNEDLMAMLLGLGGRPADQSPEMSEEVQEKSDDMNEKLGDLLNQLEGLAAEVGIDLNDSSIGDTGFDLYNWSFTEGKRQSGKGWSIAIPDGFTVIDSKDRPFEAVPFGTEKNDEESIPVHIRPGAEQDFNMIPGDMWMYHPYARAGVAGIVAVQYSKYLAQLIGSAPEILSIGFSDICAFIMIGDTPEGYQVMVMTEGKAQQLGVQTQFITDEQKKRLSNSIIAWIETFRFDKANPSMPKETKLASAKVFNDLKRGVMASFEEAVDCAQREYNTCLNGKMGILSYMSEYGLLKENPRDTIRTILTDSMEVKEFYHAEADKLVEKLKAAKVGASIMKKVYKKLKDLEEGITECTVNNKENIRVSITAKTKEIQKKWKDEAAEINKVEKAEAAARRKRREEERKKTEEARKKAEAEAKAKREEALRKYNEEYKNWEAECEAIRAKRAAYVDEKIAAEKKALEDDAARKKDDAVLRANATIKSETGRKQTAESTLASLGVFKLGEKKNQKAIIEEAAKKISDAKDALISAEAAYKSEIAAADKAANNKTITFRNAAAKEYPMPDEPKKPNL